ncbi:carbohydrate porin [Frateuria aurantia]|uniref:Carbohydrate-selective porin n=1 Tax=Frateuria aurantia (strain ATCC 33424 / DSM 6220 / KCTC 2777 / LMG 1558 / NBRC 3245 / NCIMB 13370) TaxID=767434 RepID=H8L1D0_FRAAD|nr:carbohydrate porin [Frateuria aurantia]AFC87539.1 carbohydrate-selective porin [Frateuria aurantia DSM 6220]
MPSAARCRRFVLALILAGTLPAGALATQINSPQTGLLSDADGGRLYLAGDWNGARHRLADKGVQFQFNLVNEPAYNFTGGDRHTGSNSGQLGLGASLDLERLVAWPGAQFQITVTERYGRDLVQAAHLGYGSLPQEIYGRGQTWWLTQFWLEQAFWHGRLSLRIGRMPVNADFGFNECTFMNLTFCSSTIGNMIYMLWLDWPISQWAARIKWRTGTDTYLEVAGYQVNPAYADEHWQRRHAWRLNNPGGTQGALLPLEFGWTPRLGGRRGEYKFGVYYSNAGGPDLFLNRDHLPLAIEGGPALHRHGNYGGYLSFKQPISGHVEGQGASIFLNLGRSDRHTAQLDGQYLLGLLYNGIGRRHNDCIGLGIGATHSSTYYARYARLYNRNHPGQPLSYGSGYEKTVEIYYQWVPVPAIVIRPDLQYLDDPGGSHAYRNVWLAGLKTIINF